MTHKNFLIEIKKYIVYFILACFSALSSDLRSENVPTMEYWIIYLHQFTAREMLIDQQWKEHKELAWSAKYNRQIQFLHQIEGNIWQIWVETTGLNIEQKQALMTGLSEDNAIKHIKADAVYQQKQDQREETGRWEDKLLMDTEQDPEILRVPKDNQVIPQPESNGDFIWSDAIISD